MNLAARLLRRASNARYRANNPEKVRARKRAQYLRRREEILRRSKAYREANREAVRAAKQKCYRANPRKYMATCRARTRERMKSDPLFRAARNIRGRVWSAMKGIRKSVGTLELLGCSVARVRAHLEGQFRPGMSWNNYGEWHIDHIRPCAKFDLTKPEQQKQCFHYSNVQPLWAGENLSKGAK
jgi:hypothetical protein